MKANTISEIMTKEVISVTPEQKLLDVKHIYEKENFHHHIPVVNNNQLVGMISLADFMYSINGAGLDDDDMIYTEKQVQDIMMPNVKCVDINATIDDVAETLTKVRFRALPVVENKQLVGIVTTADIIRHYLTKQKQPLH
ncbi:CBS domain-containing protein [Paucihalobacter ruber]|uniref:CBS domain-containing protein n=1 Tax=Paucihalobacter ruber TaxID=2567861 RepID=A0A506PNX7_9FLAO|nr:CBS domain-containing protein [Paucihalobacter ruber]TPV35593.1 CBS domain-containing protein [Paucihalobacter ruber]